MLLKIRGCPIKIIGKGSEEMLNIAIIEDEQNFRDTLKQLTER